MSVPKRRQTSSRGKQRRSHNALKAINLIKEGKEMVPHALKKAAQLKKIQSRTK
jgi:ribosomal protein L32